MVVEAAAAGAAVVGGAVVEAAAVGEANDPSSACGAGTVPATEATIGRVVGWSVAWVCDLAVVPTPRSPACRSAALQQRLPRLGAGVSC